MTLNTALSLVWMTIAFIAGWYLAARCFNLRLQYSLRTMTLGIILAGIWIGILLNCGRQAPWIEKSYGWPIVFYESWSRGEKNAIIHGRLYETLEDGRIDYVNLLFDSYIGLTVIVLCCCFAARIMAGASQKNERDKSEEQADRK